MQQEQLGPSVIMNQRMASIFELPSEVVLKDYKRGLDYPCGCRHCQKRQTARIAGEKSLLAAIDLYDVPDAIASDKADYFH